MASEARTIELGEVADLAALIDEVRESRQPRVLRRNGEDVAILSPVLTGSRRRAAGTKLEAPTRAEIERARRSITAASGTWHDVDAEALKEELRQQREVSTRPDFDL